VCVLQLIERAGRKDPRENACDSSNIALDNSTIAFDQSTNTSDSSSDAADCSRYCVRRVDERGRRVIWRVWLLEHGARAVVMAPITMRLLISAQNHLEPTFVRASRLISLSRMPSQLHESHLLLFRNQPTLAVDLIRDALGVELPSYREAREVSADLSDMQPAEYRADMVIELWKDAPVHGIVLEVQLSENGRKRFTWPAYVANLRARLECPVSLLVVTADDAVAQWAARSIQIGGLNQFTPYVLGPSGIPEITDEAQARENPELAVLSAMAHGRDTNAERAIEIALAAQKASTGLDADRSKIYFDLIMSSLREAARQALINMDARKYEYQSEFARRYVAQGHASGIAEGRATLIIHLLKVRFGALDFPLESRIQRASIAELDAIGERLLVAGSVEEALGPG
jgi:hypothetical protein